MINKKQGFLNFREGKNKKSQITLFIILGIIVLIAGGLYFTARQTITKEEIAPGLQLEVEEVPAELRPVQSFIENCLNQIATEGITKIGERAGFIDLIENNINTREETTNSDAVQFSKSSEYSVPYWWYLSSDNKCSGNCEFTIVPENKLYLNKKDGKTSIESQLEEYIQDNLRSCINDFKSLEEQGFKIEEKGQIQAIVTVAENDIVVYIDYPIEAEKAGKEEISKFFIRLPVNIKKIYNTALLITSMEGEYHFLERDVLNLLVGFAGIDKEIPPMSDLRFRIGKIKTWKKSEIKKNIENMLTSYIQLIKVYGARNYEPYVFPGNTLWESLYNKGMLVPGAEDYSDLEITFNYNPFWKIYLDLNCNGEVCEPESVTTDLLTLIGIQNYNFVYDISFPTEVEIYDQYAFNNRGYRFKFFLEGNIRANDPMKTDFSRIEGVFLEQTMLCDDNKRNSGEIKINVKDSITKQQIDDVQIIYSADAESCLIGSTQNSKFAGKFPVVFGGVVSFLKDGYITYAQRFDTQLNKDDELDITLVPKLTKKFTVKKRLMTKQGNRWLIGSEADMREDEEAFITLTRESNLNEADFTSAAIYSGNQTQKGDIEIAPGVYQLSINLLYNKQLRIPQRTIEEDDEEFTIQEFTLDEGFRVGGLSINYTFTNEDLKKDEIVFYVLNPDIAAIPESDRVVEDLNVVSNVDELSQQYKGSLVPRFT